MPDFFTFKHRSSIKSHQLRFTSFNANAKSPPLQKLQRWHCFLGQVTGQQNWHPFNHYTYVCIYMLLLAHTHICCHIEKTKLISFLNVYYILLRTHLVYEPAELVQLFKNQNQYLWVVSLYQCVFMHIISRDYSLAINELWMFLLCCVFSFV